MNTTAPYRPANGTAADDHKPYDEERLQWRPTSRWWAWSKKHVHFPRVRKATICLLLADLIIVVLLLRAFEPLITLLARNEELFGARLTLSRNDSTLAKPNQNEYAIPRIFHQTIATEVIPDKWVQAQQSCKEAYRDFEYKLWTDEVARDFISSEYPWFLDVWDNYAWPIQRADAIRYFILYHFGGLYLDMDTLCNATIPLPQIEPDVGHHAVFKSTRPTGISNDLLISSPRHPVFKAAIYELLMYNDITRLWAPWMPYVAIMISAGPFFLTMVAKNYLLAQPSLPSPTVQVINATALAPFITDLEGGSWHKGDTQALMWVGERPWIWFALGGIGLAAGLYVLNHVMLLAARGLGKRRSLAGYAKIAKLT